MRKIVVIVLLLAVAFIGTDACAQELAGKWSIAAVGGGVFPNDDDSDNAGYIGGAIAYGVTEYIAIGVESGYTKWDDQEGSVDYGELTAIPVLADLYFRYPMVKEHGTLIPYGILGLGEIFFDYEESRLLQDNDIQVDMNSEFAVKIGGGLEWLFTEHFAIGAEGSYVWSDGDTTTAARPTIASSTIDTDYWTVTGSLKYYF